MGLLQLNLGVRRKTGAVASSGKVPAPAVTHKHDDFSCQFCGFRSERYQRTVLGAWVGHKRPAITACVFCEPCMTLETVGQSSSGYLIWLPEMTQIELNHTVRSFYIAQAQKSAKLLADRAEAGLGALLARRAEAKRRLGTDDPLVLGIAMAETMSQEEYDTRMTRLDGVRLLVQNRMLVTTKSGNEDMFPIMLNYWSSDRGAYSFNPPEQWLKQYAPTGS